MLERLQERSSTHFVLEEEIERLKEWYIQIVEMKNLREVIDFYLGVLEIDDYLLPGCSQESSPVLVDKRPGKIIKQTELTPLQVFEIIDWPVCPSWLTPQISWVDYGQIIFAEGREDGLCGFQLRQFAYDLQREIAACILEAELRMDPKLRKLEEYASTPGRWNILDIKEFKDIASIKKELETLDREGVKKKK